MTVLLWCFPCWPAVLILQRTTAQWPRSGSGQWSTRCPCWWRRRSTSWGRWTPPCRRRRTPGCRSWWTTSGRCRTICCASWRPWTNGSASRTTSDTWSWWTGYCRDSRRHLNDWNWPQSWRLLFLLHQPSRTYDIVSFRYNSLKKAKLIDSILAPTLTWLEHTIGLGKLTGMFF